MAKCSRELYRMVDLNSFTLNSSAGFIHTGEYDTFTLLVFDFDLVQKYKGTPYLWKSYNWFKKINEVWPYLKVFTPSGGIHLYFIFDSVFEYHNRKGLNTFDENVVCDIRGHNGIIFAPGTKFEAEKNNREYFIVEKDREKKIYHKDYLKTIFQIFNLNAEEQPEALHQKEEYIYKEDMLPIIKSDTKIDVWKYIYEGTFKIKHGNHGQVPEYLVWRNLWLWIYHNNIPFHDAFIQLEKTQPEFNYKETTTQLKYVKFTFFPSKIIAAYLESFFLREIDEKKLMEELLTDGK